MIQNWSNLTFEELCYAYKDAWDMLDEYSEHIRHDDMCYTVIGAVTAQIRERGLTMADVENFLDSLALST